MRQLHFLKKGVVVVNGPCDGIDDGFATVREYFVFFAVALFFGRF
jgi:hypothetical protein